MREFGIAACQTSWSEEGGLEQVRSAIAEVMARYEWVEMIVFPELVALGPQPSRAVRLPGPQEDELRRMARDHDVWLLPGSIYERAESGQIYNTAPVIDPTGEVVGRYRKIYPFCPYEVGVSAGEEFLVFDVPGVARFGVLICYDIWFPEVMRTLSWLGAEVVLHPVLTNTMDRDLELAMARSAAAQQQCYLINVNSAGGGNMGYGRSVVVGPEGDILHQCHSGPEVVAALLDPARVRKSRERGVLGLGQPLKSFRDVPAHFPVYSEGASREGAYRKLGPLKGPARS